MASGWRERMTRLTEQAEQALRRPERDLLACADEIGFHRDSRNEVVRGALGVADISAELVITICSEGSPSPWDSPDYLTAIRQASIRMRDLQLTLGRRRQIGRDCAENVGRKLQAFGTSMAKVGEAYREVVVSKSEGGSRPNVLDNLDRFEDELSIWFASSESEEADDPRSRVTNDGSIDLAGQLTRDIRTEERAAVVFRASSIIVLVLVALVAGRYLFAGTLDERLVGPELLRLSVTVPLGVLAGYLARASYQHRSMARQLSGLRLQLVTLETFVARFSVEDAYRYRYDVAERLYSTYTPAPPESAEQPGVGQEIVVALEGLADAFRTLVGCRNGGGRSSMRASKSGSVGRTQNRKLRTR